MERCMTDNIYTHIYIHTHMKNRNLTQLVWGSLTLIPITIMILQTYRIQLKFQGSKISQIAIFEDFVDITL